MSSFSTWRYYKQSIIPATAPHIMPDLSLLKTGEIWKINRHALMSRWTEDFDCGYETDWWYCIKDNHLDLSQLNSNRRYKITKGKKNFNVSLIVPSDYCEEIIKIYIEAYKQYPRKYRPDFDAEKTRRNISILDRYTAFGAFDAATGKLEGFALMKEFDDRVNLESVKVNPEKERLNINAALVCGVCEHYSDKLSKNFYICDGERNVLHETNFQEYLIKYFGFRKAYCRLKMQYRPGFSFLIEFIYIFRHLIWKLSFIPLLCKAGAVLKMEEIRRKCDCK